MALMNFKSNQRTPPVWLKDFGSRERAILPVPAQLDPSEFTDASGITVTVDVGGAAIGATSIPVLALQPPGISVALTISVGQVLMKPGAVVPFGPKNSKKFAKLTAQALVGDTTLTVEQLPTALVQGDSGIYSPYNVEYIQSGTLVGRTYAEVTSNTPYGSADIAYTAGVFSGDDEIYLLFFDVTDAKTVTDCELCRHGSVIAINYLPNYANLTADQITWLRSHYDCIIGVD